MQLKPLEDVSSEAGPPAGVSPAHRVPPPRLYVYFDAIVRHGSIRGAAETLRIASSALNRRLLELEKEVGTQLFDRTQSGVRLTAAGEVFAGHVRRTLDDVVYAGSQIDALNNLAAGHVSIGSAESAAVDLLPRAIAEFQHQNPGVRFTVAVGAPRGMLEDLLDDRVDLILTHEAPRHHDVAILAATHKTFCALMRKGHPLASATRLLMRDCEDFPLVLAEENLAARALVEAAQAGSLRRTQPALVTNMFEVMKHYVRMTDAICFQFHRDPLADLARGGLVAIPLADPELGESSLTLAIRRGRQLPPGAAAFCERLKRDLHETVAL